MQDIYKSSEFDEAFPSALDTALSDAVDALRQFADVLRDAPASAAAVLRGYAGAGHPYGPGADAAARWYAERAISLALVSHAERHTTHHDNMGVVQSILAPPPPAR